MDGRGAWRDNVFAERLWKSVKYEEVFLHAYDTVFAAKAGINRCINFYNAERPHSSLGKRTPNEAYASFTTSTPTTTRLVRDTSAPNIVQLAA